MSNDPNLPSEQSPFPSDDSDILPPPDGGYDRPSYGATACKLDPITEEPLDQTVTCKWFTLIPSAEPPRHIPSTSIEEIHNECGLSTLGGCLAQDGKIPIVDWEIPIPDVRTCKIEHIELIPTIMRNNRWFVGARLMDRWFAGAATRNTAPQPGEADPRNLNPDFDSVTMEWLLQFSLPRKVYAQAVREEVWVNDAARKQIGKYLKRNGKFQEKRTYFDDFGRPPDKRHESHVQSRAVQLITKSNGVDYINNTYNIDDYAVSCGDANFYFIVGGHVDPPEKQGEQHTVTVTKIGVYMRDSYDFWDTGFISNVVSQPLLYWKHPDYAGFNPLGCYVNNRKFRDWRDKHGSGGDFFVYSDLKIIRPDGPRNIFKIHKDIG